MGSSVGKFRNSNIFDRTPSVKNIIMSEIIMIFLVAKS